MTDDPTNHEPTPEFRAFLEREVVRAWRRDVRFGAPAIPHRNWGVAKVAGLAASAIAMLVTGLVLGASTGYASAEIIVKWRGGTPLPPQPPLAVLRSISNITSLSCLGAAARRRASSRRSKAFRSSSSRRHRRVPRTRRYEESSASAKPRTEIFSSTTQDAASSNCTMGRSP